MKTDDLITALAAKNGRRSPPPSLVLGVATVAGFAVAALMLWLTIGARPDFVQALTSLRFDFKFVITLALAGSAFAVVRQGLYPETSGRLPLGLLLISPLLLAAAVGVELWVLPPDGYAMSTVGKNGLFCLTVIPLMGIIPLALILGSLRQAAPTRPGLAGIGAGLLAGGIAATFYAANCTDDSPLFVALWYPIAIGVLALAGGVLGRFVARW